MPRKTRTHPPDKSRLVKASLSRAKKAADHGEITAWCRQHLLPPPTFEYRFHPVRMWRFDVCWPEQRVALEIDGAVWTRGRHNRGAGYLDDMEKLNTALLHGWKVLRVGRRSNSDHPAVLYRPELSLWLKGLLG